jgi:serine protease AprX
MATDMSEALLPCALCGVPSRAEDLAEAGWLAPELEGSVAEEHPGWRRQDGACPACVQQILLEALLSKGENAFQEGIQRAWALDAEAAFGALPTPLRLHVDPRYTGRGTTLALVDSAFYPHADLLRPHNRIKAWVDATASPVWSERYGRDENPRWPGWDARRSVQWHGLMTSVVAAGNGTLSHGLYRGVAPEADLVLVQVADKDGRIGNASIERALRWLHEHRAELRLGVVNLSLGGDPVSPLAGNPVDEAVAALVADGVTVVVAAGNDGERRLVPPGTAPAALTIGGLDDKNTLDDVDRALWHSNYGETAGGGLKPELVAPSLWVVAPLMPGTEVGGEAGQLFARRAAGDASVEPRLVELKLVTPHYQHVEGTSFAAPVVAGVVACMLEANPGLRPRRIRELLVAAADPVPGAPVERQGAGALDAGRAVTLALADQHGAHADFDRSPLPTGAGFRFLLHDHHASEVRLVGSWDGWTQPGLAARAIESGLWEVEIDGPAPGTHHYKFLLDGGRWLADPANPTRAHDGFGGFNSVFTRDA